MSDKSFENEFLNVLEKVASYSLWESTKKKITDINFQYDESSLRIVIKKVEEMAKAIYDYDFYFYNSEDITEIAERLKLKNFVISGKELNLIYAFVKNVLKFCEFFKKGEFVNLKFEVLNFDIEFFKEFSRRYFSYFKDGVFDENSLPNVSKIIKEINFKRNAVLKKINDFLRDKKENFTENFYKLYDGRFVLPYKKERLKDVIVHGSSDSGNTVYGEPLWLVSENNEIIRLNFEKNNEIRKFFSEVSDFLNENHYVFENAVKNFTFIDEIYAKARYKLLNRATFPILSDEIYLKQCKNPLISPEKVVPNDIIFDKNKKLMLITGPNAGGKTAFLKNLCFSLLLYKKAVPLFCDENSKISYFENVFYVFGDESSILNDMSTFSSHISKISEFLKKSGEKDIVLIDEIMSGTDPGEGAPLSIAVIESFVFRNKCKVAASTHLNEIKRRFLGKEFCIMLSMEFNMEKLIPTYRVVYDSINSSYAFEISKLVGINDDIIEKASELMNENDKAIKEFLVILDKYKQKYLELKDEYEEKLKEIYEKEAKLEEKERSLETKLKRKYERKIEKLLKEFEEYKRVILDKLNSVKSKRDLEYVSGKINRLRNEKYFLNKKSEKRVLLKESDIKKGKEVYVDLFDRIGKIVDISKKVASVNIDGKIIKVDFKNLYESDKKNKEDKVLKISNVKVSAPNKTEINVLGLTVDEAFDEIDAFLDKAYMFNLNPVRIIHGKGILRKNILEKLNKDPRIKEIKSASYYDGGTGVSIVYFK